MSLGTFKLSCGSISEDLSLVPQLGSVLKTIVWDLLAFLYLGREEFPGQSIVLAYITFDPFCCCDKIPDEKHLQEGRVNFVSQSVMVLKAWQ